MSWLARIILILVVPIVGLLVMRNDLDGKLIQVMLATILIALVLGLWAAWAERKQ